MRPLNQAGVRGLDMFPILYPAWGNLTVHQVRVIRADGTVERVPAPRRGDQRHSGQAMRLFDLPPVQVGDVVDVEYRIDETEPDVFGEYFGRRHVFHPDLIDQGAPTRRSELVVVAPAELPVHWSAKRGDDLEFEESQTAAGETVLRWVARDLERPAPESASPRRDELVPLVDLSTYESWDAFGRWWWSFIEKEFVTSEAMRAKVRELCEGKETEAEKIEAIARFVGQEIRYNSWPFGTHGYEPFSATTIFERGFGDCKDKSILLRQMLAEIGVEAVPVLIKAEYARTEEELEVAMVEHFNHCIAYVEPTDERPGFYLDATADRNPSTTCAPTTRGHTSCTSGPRASSDTASRSRRRPRTSCAASTT